MNADPFFSFLPWLLAASLRASLAALVILGVQKALARQLPARWRFALWTPFVLILVLPALPASPLSLERLWGARKGAEPAVSTAVSMARTGVFLPTLTVEPVPGPQAGGHPVQNGALPAGLAAWRIAGLVWLSGFAGVAGMGLMAWRRQIRRIRGEATPVPSELRESVRAAAAAAGLRRLPEMVCSRAVDSPAVTGPLRPVLLLPSGFPRDLPSREAALILRHEALHLRHRDAAWDVLFWLLNAAHWFNPLIWSAFTRLRSDRETARDAEILAEAGQEERAAYGTALLRLQLPAGTPLFQTGFVGLVNGGGGMRRRIAGLAGHRRVSKGWHLTGVALGALIHLTVGASSADADPSRQPNAESPVPAPATTVQAGDAAVDKARSLILDRCQFSGASINEVADYMRWKMKEVDPDKNGVDIILDTTGAKADAVITLDLRGVSAYEVLETAAEMTGLSVSPDADVNALRVAASAPPRPPVQPGKNTGVSQLASQLILDRLQFSDARPSEIAFYLTAKSKKADPAGKGIKILITPEADKGKPVTLNLRDVSVLGAVKTVATQSGLNVEDDGEALKLVPRPAKK
ncbi:MAG: hypothetical protein EOP86_07375 [Verrucomicrobiaceae bacterium]|nr:MAG: hypothetical protein EOP86_07375 [Verrucomicrobiaceae bacterium]